MYDFACIGDGERTLEEFPEILKAGKAPDEFRKVDGLGFRNIKSEIVITSTGRPIHDIYNLTDPACDLRSFRTYNGEVCNHRSVIGDCLWPNRG